MKYTIVKRKLPKGESGPICRAKPKYEIDLCSDGKDPKYTVIEMKTLFFS